MSAMPNRYTYPDTTAVLEDLAFLDDHKVGATEAARRLGFPTAEALEKWLTRRDHFDLWKRLMHHDPPGTHDTTSRRKKQAARRQQTGDAAA